MTATLSASMCSGLASAGGMVYRSSSDTARAMQQLREEGPRSPKFPHSRMHPGPARQAAAARRRRRSQLSRLFAAALVVTVLTGTTSYRMHMAQERSLDDSGGWDGGGPTLGGPLAALRDWFVGARAASRRSLREGPPGLTSLNMAAPGSRLAAGTDIGANAAGVLQFERWWMLDGFAQLEAAEQQQQRDGSGVAAVDGGGGGADPQPATTGADAAGLGETPVQRLLRLRRLDPSAFKLYDFKEKRWRQHNVTRIPVDVPVARWAVASLINKAKKRESILFLVGGYSSPREVAAGRPPRPPKTEPAGGTVAARSVGGTGGAAAGAVDKCPLASAAVFAANTGRSKFRTLPPLPDGRYGGAAVVAGARLHFMGGWGTPDRAARLALPAAEHWSIGLNADGSSAPEWQREGEVPPALVGRRLTVLSLNGDEEGEPIIFAWTDGSVDSGGGGTGEEACYAREALDAFGSGEGSSSGGGAGSGGSIELWSYAASAGWRLQGLLPQPLADDLQCAAAASAFELVAVGAEEQSGLFTRQRGVWQFDARDGGRWTRAGWAPVQFEGHLCALYHTRLYTSGGLPPPLAEQVANELGPEDGEVLGEAAAAGLTLGGAGAEAAGVAAAQALAAAAQDGGAVAATEAAVAAQDAGAASVASAAAAAGQAAAGGEAASAAAVA